MGVQNTSHTYHYPLDLVRFAAALLVMAFHLAFYSWASSGSSTANALQGVTSFAPALPWTWFGWIGVEVFFVISGFVISNSAAGVTSGHFLKGRVLRLIPAAWICATLTMLVRDMGGADRLGTLVRPYAAAMSLFFVGPWIDGVYWSLVVEITFYALIFGLLQFRAFQRLPVLAGILTLASAAFLLLTETRFSWHVTGWHYIAAASEPMLLRHGAFFAVGIWLWIWSERRLGLFGAIGLVAAIPVAWLEIWMRGADLQGMEAPSAVGQPLLTPIIIWTVAMAVLMVVTRWPARFTPRSKQACAGLRRIGLATYPLYLLHNVVGATLIRLMVRAGAPKWAALGLAVLTVVSLAFLVALIFEPRLRGVLRRLIERLTESRLRACSALVAPPAP